MCGWMRLMSDKTACLSAGVAARIDQFFGFSELTPKPLDYLLLNNALGLQFQTITGWTASSSRPPSRRTTNLEDHPNDLRDRAGDCGQHQNKPEVVRRLSFHGICSSPSLLPAIVALSRA